MASNRIEVVLLDIGGIVLKIDWAETVKSLDLLHHKEFMDLIGNIGQWEAYDLYEKGKISRTEFCGRVRGHLNLPLVEAQIVDAWNAIILGELEGIDSVLAAVKSRVRLYALSNTNEMHMEYVVPKYQSLRHFEQIFTSWELGLRKPDPDIYRRVAKELGVLPGAILFVDDSPANVKGARVAGMHAEVSIDSSQKLCDILREYNVL